MKLYMKERPYLWPAGLFIIAAAAYFVWFNLNKPRVLVLQSYDKRYAWTRDVDVGLKSVLDHKYHYSVRWYYMDTKRHPGYEFKEKAALAARRVIATWRPHVIIAVDDDAQQYVARRYVNNQDVIIVFSGVNARPEDYGYDKATNVTGILERKQLEGVKQALVEAHNAGKLRGLRVVHLGDTSDSVKWDDKYMRDFDWSPVRFHSKLVKTFEEWKAVVTEEQQEVDVILTTNYRKLARSASDPDLVEPAEVVTWTEAISTVPVIGTNGFFIEDGGMLAVGTSPYEQGEIAARMVEQIIDKGVAPDKIPVVSTKEFVIYMRENLMKKRGLELPQVYLAFARATNNYYP